MNKVLHHLAGFALLAPLLLAGCGTLSQVSTEGTTDEPVFPDTDREDLTRGTWPNLENLRKVRPGMTREQLYALIDVPHFSEGFHVREWDYHFHFPQPHGKVLSCQYKVLFDKDLLAQSFYWHPQACAAVLNVAQTTPSPQVFSLDGDVSFAFGSAALTPAGQARLADIAGQLRQYQTITRLEVAGHTDRIGSDASNDVLSQRRAQSVRQELIRQGVPAEVIHASGYGKHRPVVQCEEQARASLIACLAPNRRVEITAQMRQ